MKVVFLDRDGVINKYPGDRQYVTSWRQFQFISGSVEGIRKLNEKGFKIFVVSNQAGVAKGLYLQKELDSMTKKMLSALKRQNTHLDGVYYCVHREEDNCSCRKPKTGLLQKAITDFGIHLTIGFFIGDSFKDMKAARDFGLKGALVLSGREKIANRQSWEFEPDYIFDNLLLAAHYVCQHYG